MKIMQKYFTSGLLFLIPLWILFVLVQGIASLVTNMVNINVLIGFVIAVALITGLGFVVRRIFKRYMRSHMQTWSEKPGLLGLLVKAVMQIDDVSEKTQEAFHNPVLYKVDDGIYKLGFITDEDMNILGTTDITSSEASPAQGAMWIYAPQPVTMMGELVLVESRKISKITSEQVESIPLFVMSAGLIEQSA